jgi:hypothetical protein
MHLFNYRFSLPTFDQQQTEYSAFRLDFKLFIVNSFLQWLNSPELLIQSETPAKSSPLLSVMFLVVNSGVFEYIDETVEDQLHSLVKSVPVTLL